MNREQVDQIIENLSKKLSIPANKIWEVLLKQTKVEIFKDILWVLMFSLLIFGLYKLFFILQEECDKGGENDGWRISQGLCIVTIGCVLLLVSYFVSDFITLIYNPEYWVLQSIFSIVK